MFSLILHGSKLAEKQKWRNLRDSLNLLQNAFSSATVTDLNPKGNTFTISYLIESLGLTKKLAETISRRVTFEEKANPDSILQLLRTHGFKDSQISTIISSYPRLLITDAEKSLRPKLEVLQSTGASSSELSEIVSKVPKILEKKEGKSLILYYDFVKEIMQEGKKSKVSNSWPEGKPGNKIRNISILRELGVPQKLLYPLLISNCQPVCGKEKFEETLKKVIEMGFDPTKSKFVEALHVIYEMSDETIQEKVKIYKRLGFSEDDIWTIFKKWPFFLKFSENKIKKIFESLKKCGLVQEEVLSVLKTRPQCIRASEKKILDSIETFTSLGFSKDEFKIIIKRFPQCIAYSAEMVKKKFEFLVKKMNWPLEALVLIPAVFGYSLEKRTVPRCKVIKVLMEKGLMGRDENPPISSVLVCTDLEFLNRYVVKNEKVVVNELMDILKVDRSVNLLTPTMRNKG